MTKNEPQSYGSQKDWVTGHTGENVNHPKATPPADDFYESRHDSDGSAPEQGGKVSPVQEAESAQPSASFAQPSIPVTGVTVAEGGARRGGYFRNRDYKRR
jgi:hypothetical protein